jgi:hypothetical protein
VLPRYKIELVRRLLSTKEVSRRAIARSAAVSRGSVAAIAERGAFIPSGVPDEESIEPLVPACRCATCGRWVVPPCHACATESLLEKQRLRRRGRPRYRPFIVGLDLLPRHFVRYLEVRRYRRALEGDE